MSTLFVRDNILKTFNEGNGYICRIGSSLNLFWSSCQNMFTLKGNICCVSRTIKEEIILWLCFSFCNKAKKTMKVDGKKIGKYYQFSLIKYHASSGCGHTKDDPVLVRYWKQKQIYKKVLIPPNQILFFFRLRRPTNRRLCLRGADIHDRWIKYKYFVLCQWIRRNTIRQCNNLSF